MAIEFVEYDGSYKHESSVLSLARAYYEEAAVGAYKDMRYSRKWTLQCLKTAADLDNHKIFLVLDYKIPVGGIWVTKTSAIHTPDPMGMDCFNFVLKSHRGTGIGLKLAKMGEEWLKSQGCKMVIFGCNSGVEDNEPAKRLYKGMGYDHLGHNFIKFVS